jgi:hypothetical protein
MQNQLFTFPQIPVKYFYFTIYFQAKQLCLSSW